MGRTSAPTATATIATGVAIMMALSPQMEGHIAATILTACVPATSVLSGPSDTPEIDFTYAHPSIWQSSSPRPLKRSRSTDPGHALLRTIWD